MACVDHQDSVDEVTPFDGFDVVAPGFHDGHVVGSFDSLTGPGIPFSPTVVVTGTIGVTGSAEFKGNK